MSSVNGYELKTPAECGYTGAIKGIPESVAAVVVYKGRPLFALDESENWHWPSQLVHLPKPPVTRPFTMDELRKLRDERGGVLWFRFKKVGYESQLVGISESTITLYGHSIITPEELYDKCHLLTNGQPGVAGVGE